MCSTKTSKSKVTSSAVGNQYLDNGDTATGLAIGRNQLKNGSAGAGRTATVVPQVGTFSRTTMPQVGRGVSRV